MPILGICYGMQLMAQTLGGEVTAAQDSTAREYGRTETHFSPAACSRGTARAERHLDEPRRLHHPPARGLPRLCRHGALPPTGAIADEARGFYGVQFHPEVNHTEHGQDMIRNFLYRVCGCTGTWNMGDYMRSSIAAIREKVGDGKVLLALSGGVDSSVAAALIAEAVGDQLTCVFVDHGLMRKNEGDEVEAAFPSGICTSSASMPRPASSASLPGHGAGAQAQDHR